MSEHTGIYHKLKLHQDDKGTWWPELEINIGGCEHMYIDKLRGRIVDRLAEVISLLQSDEAINIEVMAKMVSK